MQNEIIWTPSEEVLQNSNLKKFMEVQGIADFEKLRSKSIAEVEWFWDAVSRFLEIEWLNPYSKVLDLSEGIQWPKWFVGGKINLSQNCLDKHQAHSAEKTALISEREDGTVRTLSYRELFELTSKIANAIEKIGVGKGDKVGIYMPLIPEAIASFLAIIRIGAVVIPIFSGYGKEAIVTRLSDCDAKVLITAEKFSRRGKEIDMKKIALEAVESVPSLKSVLIYGNYRQDRMPSTIKGSSNQVQLIDWSVVENSKPFRAFEVTDSEDPFMIIYTSGTTGKPKGAVHVHGGFLVKVAEEISFQLDLHKSDNLFWVTDMGWIMAPWEIVGVLSTGAMLTIYDGAPDYPSPDRLWKLIEDHKVTELGISPTLVRALMKYGEAPLQSCQLPSLRAFGSTGEPWNPESYMWLFEKVGKRKNPIINISGGTEVGACFLSVHPILPLKVCSVGGPCLGIDADVFDENGRSIRNKTGELVVKNAWPSITRGLWKANDRYLETYWSRFPGVWVHGDWASIDSDGFWFLHGRSDDTIKIAGKRLGPTEVESILASHPAVLESIAIGVPDPLKGEAIACFVVLRPNYRGTLELASELKDLIAKNLGSPLKPREIIFVDSLPKTRNAKLVRRLVKAKFLKLPMGDTTNIENPDSLDVIPSDV
ncbi:MAG: AMP-binding protein [Thaumarchaeota archaeon]|nr:AMP-binding protein [Nitrososphaerota archaeon]